MSDEQNEMQAELTGTLDLGSPDFSDLINDDSAEITADDLGASDAKAQTGLKASYAIKKFMPMVFTIIAKRRGEHWILDNEEVEELATATDECIEHYYPGMPHLPPWAMLVMASGSIIIPRIILDDFSDDEKKLVNEQLTDSNPAPIGHNTVLRTKEVG